MTLDMEFLRRRSTSTLAAVRSPSAMLEPLLVVAFPVPDIRKSLVTRRPPEEMDTTLRRSWGLRLSMTNPTACFRSASFAPSCCR